MLLKLILKKFFLDDFLIMSLSRMRRLIEGLLSQVGSLYKEPLKSQVFLINNYDIILSIYDEQNIECLDRIEMDQLLQNQIKILVEEELVIWYKNMINFVKSYEMVLDLGIEEDSIGVIKKQLNLQDVEKIVIHFTESWKSNLEKINRNFISYFTNLNIGMNILQCCFTQLMVYYQRLLDIIKKIYGNPDFIRRGVAMSTMLHEIKMKYIILK